MGRDFILSLGDQETSFHEKIKQERFKIVNPITPFEQFLHSMAIAMSGTVVVTFTFLYVILSWIRAYDLLWLYSLHMYSTIVFWLFPPILAGWYAGPRTKVLKKALVLTYIGCVIGCFFGYLFAELLLRRVPFTARAFAMFFLGILIMGSMFSLGSIMSVILSSRVGSKIIPEKLTYRMLSEGNLYIDCGEYENAISLYTSACRFLEKTRQSWNQDTESLDLALSICEDNLRAIREAYSSVDSSLDIDLSSAKGVETYRGCEIVGDRFEYKVKVQNRGSYVINDVSVTIVSYPSESLSLVGDGTKRISRIEVGGFRSPQFVFTPTEDCVRGKIVSVVSFRDAKEQVHTLNVKPYTIRSVCDLLKPVHSLRQELETLVQDFETVVGIHEVPINIHELKERVHDLLVSKNFAITDTAETTGGGQSVIILKGIAAGKYTGKHIAVVLTLTGDIGGSESAIQVDLYGEDISMLPTTLAEISHELSSWVCIHCGAPLPAQDIVMLKKEIAIICKYCNEVLEISKFVERGESGF